MTDWTISCDGFCDHIDWLESQFEFVSLQEAQRRIRDNDSPRPAVAITFDDGYADNGQFALPLLIRRRIPVTYFVSTDHVMNDVPFSHDEELGLNLARNDIDSLRDLAHCGVEIGAHTRTHLKIDDSISDDVLFDEVVSATKELEAAIDRPVRHLAIPFGKRANLDRRVFQLALDHGLEGVCSAYGGMNLPGRDAFHLQRIHGDPELSRLKNWLTWDPRVLRTSVDHPRFDLVSNSTSEVTPIETPPVEVEVTT